MWKATKTFEFVVVSYHLFDVSIRVQQDFNLSQRYNLYDKA